MTTYTWNSTNSGDWNTSANWSPNGIPSTASDYVVISNSGSYTITIGSSASDAVSGITITALQNILGGVAMNPTIAVDGTLDFTGSAGAISEGSGDISNLLVNNGTIVNGGSMDPMVQVTNVASFIGTNTVYFTDQLEALPSSTAVVDPSAIMGLSGGTLADGVFNATDLGTGSGGTIELGGSALTADITTLSGNANGNAWIILNGAGSELESWNGTAYATIENTLTNITGGGTLESLNRNYTSSNNITLDNGAMIFAQDTVSTGTVTINANGRYLGNATTVTNDLVNNGTVQAGSGMMVLKGSLGGTGTLGYFPDETGVPASDLGTIEVTGATANNVQLLAGRGIQLDDPAGFSGSITAPIGSNIILGNSIIATSATLTNGTLDVMNGTSTVAALTMAGTYTGDVFNVSSVAAGTEISVAQATVTCFVRGTRIRTPEGDLPVEELVAGQLVVTANGRTAPVVWIGRRHLDCRRHPAPQTVLPVRIRANAFGPGLPQRDLLMSPQHAVYDEGVLIPIRYLINGSTVMQDQVAKVEYYHIELPQHDVLLAEGLPAESYLENNDRDSFENGGGTLRLHPDFSRWSWDGRACAELKVVGPQVDAVRAKLEQAAVLNEQRAA